MRVSWVHFGAIQVGPLRESAVASARYRALIPSSSLEQRGHRIEFLDLTDEDSLERTGEPSNVYIITKLLSPTRPDGLRQVGDRCLRFVQSARSRGAHVISDHCDDHFAHPLLGSYYRQLINSSHAVVASTRSLADIIRLQTGREAAVISDPVEGNQKPAHFNPPRMLHLTEKLLKQARFPERVAGYTRPLRLLWYGHPSNLDTLDAFLPDLARLARQIPVSLDVMTAPQCGAETLCQRYSQGTGSALAVNFLPWALVAMWPALDRCDIVVLPSNVNSQRKLVKSPNRLLEALWGGRYVVADPLPSYQGLEQWVWLNGDLITGIRWALANPQEVESRVGRAQEYIQLHHSSEAIADQWQALLERTLAEIDAALDLSLTQPTSPLPSSSARQPQESLRLNLGCGDKLLPGYVNVDVAASRLDKRPDVLCDLHSLTPFTSDCAEEILAVHVIEHFWRWEVIDILKEWARVLKPGGKIILECPNLISACQEFLADPERAAGGGPEGQRSMWVFYGDPKWRDPLMVHRWGYTPQSLKAVLMEAGFVNVRQEQAQFKLREPRDMRIVGEKQSRAAIKRPEFT